MKRPLLVLIAGLALAVNRIFPGTAASVYPAAFALVAMGAVFGAASRATFTFIIFAFEITGDYNAVLPLMLVSVIADGIALWANRTSIMTEKLARRGLKIHTDGRAARLAARSTSRPGWTVLRWHGSRPTG